MCTQFPKSQPSNVSLASVALANQFLGSWMICPEIAAQMHAKLSKVQSVPMLNDFDRIFLIKFTRLQFILIIFIVSVGFQVASAKITQNFGLDCDPQSSRTGESYSEMRTLSPFFFFDILHSVRDFWWRLDKNTGSIASSGLKSIEKFSPDFRVVRNCGYVWTHLCP